MGNNGQAIHRRDAGATTNTGLKLVVRTDETMDIKKLSVVDWAKIAGGATIVGTLVGTLMSADRINSVLSYGEPISAALTGLAAVAAAFVIALRKRA